MPESADKPQNAHFKDVAVFLQKGNPVVIYMGLKKLPEIIGVLMECGVPADTCVCAISQVSNANQDFVEATFDTIEQKLSEHPLALPTVIILGKYAETVK